MNTVNKRSLHPMMMAACIGLFIFCAVGIAAMMGWIPNSMGKNPEASALIADNKPAEVKKPQRVAQTVKQQAAPVRVASTAKTSCSQCGVVESVRTIETRGTGSGVGAVGGAVVGGLLGNQVGGGNGKKSMTVVGALGGAVAGHEIEKSARANTSYETVVRMENGSSRTITNATQPSWHSGDHVKVIDGVIRSS